MSWISLIRSQSIKWLKCSRSFSWTNVSRQNVNKDVSKPLIVSSSQSSVSPSSPSFAKDVIMYRYENPRFFRLLNFFAVMQFGFWLFLSTSSFTLIDAPVQKPSTEENAKNKKETEEDLPFWRKINLGADKYKYGLGIASFLMGYSILSFSWIYILRSVRFLVLRKDKKNVSFVTYGPFGKNRIMDVPLNCISAAGSRTGLSSQMPIKVKGRRFFYMVDLKDGEFLQTKLFDQTVGLQRKF